MIKIKSIEYNGEYIELETSDKYVYKIPNNNSYIRNLLYRGIDSNKALNKDIKYYDKCADICVYPIWISLAFLIYGVVTNFLVMELIMILSGGMVGISLTGTTVFKMVSKRLKDKANNNEYFTKIYEYAKNGGKIKINELNNIKQNVKNNDCSKKGNEITQDKKIQSNNNYYHLNRNQIIQDEEVHQRKR